MVNAVERRGREKVMAGSVRKGGRIVMGEGVGRNGQGESAWSVGFWRCETLNTRSLGLMRLLQSFQSFLRACTSTKWPSGFRDFPGNPISEQRRLDDQCSPYLARGAKRCLSQRYLSDRQYS